MLVLAALPFWSLLYWARVSGSGQARCEFQARRSVLKVTLTDLDPRAAGYYVMVERQDRRTVVYDHTERKQEDMQSAMVYEVMDIPTTTPPYNYTVRVRPHRKNPNKYLGHYQAVCNLTLPPPPPTPPPSSQEVFHPHPPPAHRPPPLPPPTGSSAVDNNSDLKESVEERAHTQQTEYGGPSLLLMVVVTGGVGTFCLAVCLTVTVNALKQRSKERKASRLRARTTIPVATTVAPDHGDADVVENDDSNEDEDDAKTCRSLSDVGSSATRDVIVDVTRTTTTTTGRPCPRCWCAPRSSVMPGALRDAACAPAVIRAAAEEEEAMPPLPYCLHGVDSAYVCQPLMRVVYPATASCAAASTPTPTHTTTTTTTTPGGGAGVHNHHHHPRCCYCAYSARDCQCHRQTQWQYQCQCQCQGQGQCQRHSLSLSDWQSA